MTKQRCRAAGLVIGAMTMTVTMGTAAAGEPDNSQNNDSNSEGEERTEQFTALSYNVAGLPEILSGSDPAVNTPLISPLLNAYDLVLVQESWANPDPRVDGIETYHEQLVSEVTHPYLSTPAPSPWHLTPEERQRSTALVADGLNRMSQFPFSDMTRVMWDNCFGGGPGEELGQADCLSEKGFSVARTTLAPGVEVDIYNLHAQAGRDPQAVQYREEGFAQLATFMEDYSPGRAIIVGGDFNVRHADDGEAFATFLDTAGLTEACEALDCDEHDELDKFAFRSGGGVTLEALNHSFERDRFQRHDGEPLSDHDALAVTFQWTATVTDDADPSPPDTSTTPGDDHGRDQDSDRDGSRGPTTPAARPVSGQPRLTG